jgi:hypothetical protein
VEVTLPVDVDLKRAEQALEATEVTPMRVVAVDAEGLRLQLKAAKDAGANREAREGELRGEAQHALREAGVLRAP